MKLHLGNYLLYINTKFSYLKPKKARHPYSGLICDVCGQTIKGGGKGLHTMNHHPEYAFGVTPDREYRAYRCFTCGKVFSGVAVMIRHYRDYHPEKLKPNPTPS